MNAKKFIELVKETRSMMIRFSAGDLKGLIKAHVGNKSDFIVLYSGRYFQKNFFKMEFLVEIEIDLRYSGEIVVFTKSKNKKSKKTLRNLDNLGVELGIPDENLQIICEEMMHILELFNEELTYCLNSKNTKGYF